MTEIEEGYMHPSPLSDDFEEEPQVTLWNNDGVICGTQSMDAIPESIAYIHVPYDLALRFLALVGRGATVNPDLIRNLYGK